MAEVVLFHHVQGLTDGVRAFAEELRVGGHTVHTPDLFDGERAATVEDGIALVGRIGEETIDARVNEIVAGLPQRLVYGGFSFGGASAQRLAQTRPGARGALMYEASYRSPPSGPSARGPTGFPCRSTAWTRTRISRSRGIWTPPASWSG